MDKYYVLKEVYDDLNDAFYDEVIEFEYVEPDSRSFLLRTEGYRGKFYNRIRISNKDTYLCVNVINSFLEKLDMIYVNTTLQTYKGRDYIDIEDINDLHAKLIKTGLIKRFLDYDDEERKKIKENR